MTGIIVAFPNIDNAKKIKDILVRNGFRHVSACTSGAQALQEVEDLQNGVILCSYRLPDMIYWDLKDYLPPGFELVTVTSKDQWNAYGDQSVVNLSLPLKVHELISTLEMVITAMERARKRKRNVPKKRSKEEQDLIDQAKAILMSRNSMTEEEAHRYLQKTSMDNGTSFTETAQMILSMMDYQK